MTLEEFLVIYTIRAPQLMWFVGAGSSAAAGIPTAGDLIWKFKQTLFCASQKISLKSVEDLTSPIVQQRLTRYFEGLGRFPTPGAPDEYAAFFEATYPYPEDRRTFIDKYVRDGSPSFGHMALGVLFALDRARIVWTTNFDRLLEDAAIKVLGSSSRIVVASLDNTRTAREALRSDRWPLVCKLHGDFQSSRLKNTSEELRTQDAEMSRLLVDSCQRFGLVVMGYSGRDESVMHALTEGILSGNGYPGGLFWFHCPGTPVFPAVTRLIEEAQRAGIQAALIESDTFDETLGDIIKQIDGIPAELAAKLDAHRPRVTDVPVPEAAGGWPVVRLNALPVPSYPTVFRLIECDVGGSQAVREILAKTGAAAVAARRKTGVLAFGADTELRNAFGPFGIRRLDTQSLEPRRLGYDSIEVGLLRDAFAVALGTNRPLRVVRRRNADLCVLDSNRAKAEVDILKKVTEQISGIVPQTSVRWEEALYVKLTYRLGRMWLLIEPSVRISLDESVTEEKKNRAKDFVRERLAARYNRKWNALLDAWSKIIVGPGQECTLKAFHMDEGLNATFVVHGTTGFSRRGLAR